MAVGAETPPAAAVASDPSHGDTGEVSSNDTTPGVLPDLLRVRVALASFQGPTVFSCLWTEEGESFEGFQTRAEILLNDDPSFLSVVPVDPQPASEFFTFLLCPKWWSLAGVRSFLLMGSREGTVPCMLAWLLFLAAKL